MKPTPPTDPVVLKGLSVLVIEDAWQVAKALKGLLEQYEIEVIGPVATATDAKRQFDIRKPQAALVDVNLKGELAWDLIDHLSENGVEVIITTGYPQLMTKTRAPIVHLQKPYPAEELLSALSDIARRR